MRRQSRRGARHPDFCTADPGTPPPPRGCPGVQTKGSPGLAGPGPLDPGCSQSEGTQNQPRDPVRCSWTQDGETHPCRPLSWASVMEPTVSPAPSGPRSHPLLSRAPSQSEGVSQFPPSRAPGWAREAPSLGVQFGGLLLGDLPSLLWVGCHSNPSIPHPPHRWSLFSPLFHPLAWIWV